MMSSRIIFIAIGIFMLQAFHWSLLLQRNVLFYQLIDCIPLPDLSQGSIDICELCDDSVQLDCVVSDAVHFLY